MSQYIDKSALCEALMKRWNTADKNAEKAISNLMACVITPIVVGMPSVDVRENVHGEWILNHMSQLWECSNCHKEEIRTTDFCPNCGADMRKGVE